MHQIRHHRRRTLVRYLPPYVQIHHRYQRPSLARGIALLQRVLSMLPCQLSERFELQEFEDVRVVAYQM
jgi:hypothetical protein